MRSYSFVRSCVLLVIALSGGALAVEGRWGIKNPLCWFLSFIIPMLIHYGSDILISSLADYFISRNWPSVIFVSGQHIAHEIVDAIYFKLTIPLQITGHHHVGHQHVSGSGGGGNSHRTFSIMEQMQGCPKARQGLHRSVRWPDSNSFKPGSPVEADGQSLPASRSQCQGMRRWRSTPATAVE